ncbi:MAG: cellulase family glycosylhydrolase [Ruminococcus sp.]|nr:cellulase family glycosylhydrolase [Ruminococcus sp.]
MKKFRNALAAFLALTMLSASGAATGISAVTAATDSTAAVDDCNAAWLHAGGSQLDVLDGNEVWRTGATWFGFNCSENCAHYLWSADIDDMLSSIADHGINVIRFPISSELLISWMNGTPNEVSSVSASIDPYYSINPAFCNADGSIKHSREIFDIIMQKCKEYGLKAFVDIHSPNADNSGHNYNLWYGKETSDGTMVTTELWIESLVWLADKYKNDDTLLAYDLKNEPHGKGQEGSDAAKWDDSTDENNWAYAATQCANAILEVNPNALILVEGVEQQCKEGISSEQGVEYYWGMPDSKTDSPYYPAWWGGQLRGVRDNPIVPDSGTSQIVYSPHDYGPSVYAQTWFDKDFTTETLLDDYWYDTWAYINAEDIAPLLVGEWGGFMDGAENQKWMELLRDYMIDNHINHTFWCLNTNSGDTGGLWTGFSYSPDTGTTIEWDDEKYALVEEALWQTLDTGKYIGLDHQKALGNNDTGISLSEFYASYAYTEGSNLDGGTILSADDTTTSSTTAATEATTEATTEAITESSTEATDSDTAWGDANVDGAVDISDAVSILSYVSNVSKYPLTEQGLLNADVNQNGDGISNSDALAVQRYISNVISELPESYN